MVAHAGGWNISGNLDPSVGFEERVGVVQNELGLSVFFNWGVIEHNGSYSVAVIAGGWNEALVLVRFSRDCFNNDNKHISESGILKSMMTVHFPSFRWTTTRRSI